MSRIITILIVLGVVIAIFLTTRKGKEISSQLGLELPGKGRVPREDHEYLLRVCGGDVNQLRRRLDATRMSNPELSEAGAYRRAIREHLNKSET